MKIQPFNDVLLKKSNILNDEQNINSNSNNRLSDDDGVGGGGCGGGDDNVIIDMIVVASLVANFPNLGGIARTCEAFGIKNLILNSLKYVENKEFKNLSMTAENWLNINEVKISSLPEYILMKKNEGYVIIGAEQTAKSEKLDSFKFPKKCILLLGHEKEGIPPNLIGILDHAVEIQQFGMIRSLNVHVSASLFMWEFCKQHKISTSSS